MGKSEQYNHKFDYETYETEREWVTPIGEYNIIHLDCPTKQEIQQRVTDFLNELVDGGSFDDDCPLCQSMAAQPYNVVYYCTRPCYECDKVSRCKNLILIHSRNGRNLTKPIKRCAKYYVYIVECQDGTYYTGYTNNLNNRIKEHNNAKRAARYLRGKLPVRLLWHKEYRYYKRAIQAERRIKHLTHKRKEELANIYAKNQTRQ